MNMKEIERICSDILLNLPITGGESNEKYL